jgi:hypothetical protein
MADNVISFEIVPQTQNGNYARVQLVNGGKVNVQLGSVDHFLKRLEQI